MQKTLGLFVLLTFVLALSNAGLSYSASSKVLVIIAQNGFRDEEFFVTKKVLEENGFKVVVASKTTDLAFGMLGGAYKPDLALKKVKLRGYKAVVFVGGVGAKDYFDYKPALKIAREAYRKGLVIGAICIAPVILAKAGVLKGKKATVWYGEAQILEELGAIYTGKDVEVDGKIVTANGPWAVKKFARTLVQIIKGETSSPQR